MLFLLQADYKLLLLKFDFPLKVASVAFFWFNCTFLKLLSANSLVCTVEWVWLFCSHMYVCARVCVCVCVHYHYHHC